MGNEWYPYQTWTVVENSGAALAAFVLGALAMSWRGQRPNRATLTAFGLSVVFGLMLFKSRRFVEYYPGFALIFLALAAKPIVSGWLSGVEQRISRPRLASLAAPLALAALMALPMVRTLGGARDAMRRSQPPPAQAYRPRSAFTTYDIPESRCCWLPERDALSCSWSWRESAARP